MEKDRATNAAGCPTHLVRETPVLRQETRAASFHCYIAQIGIHGENGATGSLRPRSRRLVRTLVMNIPLPEVCFSPPGQLSSSLRAERSRRFA